jgi:hypothetical protein
MGGEHVHGPQQALQRAHLPLVKLHVVGPVFDGADRGHRLHEPQQRLRRIALAGRNGILERNDRQLGGLRNAAEMGDRHFGVLPQGERRRRKDEQRRSAAGSRSARDPRRLLAAVRPYAVHDRQPVADLVGRDFHDPALFLERAGGDFGRMGIDRDGRKPLRRRDVTQMRAKAPFVDRKIVLERQQNGRYDARGNEGRVARHEDLLRGRRQILADRWAGRTSKNPPRRPSISPALCGAECPHFGHT